MSTTPDTFLCDSRSGNGCAGLVPKHIEYWSKSRILPESGRMQFEGSVPLTREYLAQGTPVSAPFATAASRPNK